MLIVVLLLVSGAFGLGAWLGAPYLPILRRDHQALLDLCELRAGQTLLDLGSGDGRLLRYAASRGINCIGYEINPLVYAVSLIVCWRYRSRITIHLANFWSVKLPPADAVYVFLIDRYMRKLDHKLSAEITRPTPVVSYIFDIPGRKAQKSLPNAKRYLYGTGR